MGLFPDMRQLRVNDLNMTMKVAEGSQCGSPDSSVHTTAGSSDVHHGEIPAGGLVRLLRLPYFGQHLVDTEISLEAPPSQHYRQVPVLLVHGLRHCLDVIKY